MRGQRHTGLAAQILDWAERARSTETPLGILKQTLESLGEDYADCADQCRLAMKDSEHLYERLLDLAAMVLKADKAAADAASESADYQAHQEYKDRQDRKRSN